MIQLYTGTPGSGKSLHSAHDIRFNLRLGKKVISTCYIDTSLCFLNPIQEFIFNKTGKLPKKRKKDKREDNFYYIDINDITPEYLYNFAARFHEFGKEHQTIVYFDECVAIFSPTVISDKKDLWNRWEDFFRKHRHLGFDCILIPQASKLISRKVIEYCEFEVRHYNRKHQGILGFFMALFAGGLFSYSTYWRGIRSKPLDSGFYTYKPLYGQMYNSYSMFDSTLAPYKAEWEKKKILLSRLCYTLEQRKNALQNEAAAASSELAADENCNTKGVI